MLSQVCSQVCPGRSSRAGSLYCRSLYAGVSAQPARGAPDRAVGRICGWKKGPPVGQCFSPTRRLLHGSAAHSSSSPPEYFLRLTQEEGHAQDYCKDNKNFLNLCYQFPFWKREGGVKGINGTGAFSLEAVTEIPEPVISNSDRSLLKHTQSFLCLWTAPASPFLDLPGLA